MDRQSKKICAYCGKSGTKEMPLTMDHIVPRALWKDIQYPKHFKTVKSCEACQKEWDQDATYFRRMVVGASDPDDHPALVQLAVGPVQRELAKSPRDREDFIRNARRSLRKSLGSNILLPSILVPLDVARFNRTPEKIIRGFFFMRNAKPLPIDYEVCIYPHNEIWHIPAFQELINSMEEWAGFGDDIFQMRSVRDTTDPDTTAWLFAFYKSFSIFGHTRPKNFAAIWPKPVS